MAGSSNQSHSQFVVESCKANVDSLVSKAKEVALLININPNLQSSDSLAIQQLDELYSVSITMSKRMQLSDKKLMERKNLIQAAILEAGKNQTSELLHRYVQIIQTGCYNA